MLFGVSHPEDLVIGPIVVGLVTCWVGSLIQFFVVWLRSRRLNKQLARIQDSMTTRMIQVVQATVYRKE